ncbi:hypothetical protein DL96DRAFT_1591119 [Flagelloscypha sp. PMI_526]|nr:hypothetical protein DL96DRAFT_1591119 [Flagelloscypha sp. PMI_526]
MTNKLFVCLTILLALSIQAAGSVLISKELKAINLIARAFETKPSESGLWALTNDGGEQSPYWTNLDHPAHNTSVHENDPRSVSNYFTTYDSGACEGNRVAQIAPIVDNQCYTALYKSVFFSIPTSRSVIRLYRSYGCDGTYKSAILYNFYGCYTDPASESLGSLRTYQGTWPEASY